MPSFYWCLNQVENHLHILHSKFVQIFLFAILFMPVSAICAQSFDWSFENHPHPRAYKKTKEQSEALGDMASQYFGSPVLCHHMLKFEWHIYLQNHPEYRQLGDTAGIKAAWEHHLVENNYWSLAPCIAGLRASQLDVLDDLLATSEIGYCGQFNQLPALVFRARII